MTKLIVSAVLFILAVIVVFWRERGRWKRYNAAQQEIDAKIPSLIQAASSRYEKKFGRAPSVLEDYPQIAAAAQQTTKR